MSSSSNQFRIAVLLCDTPIAPVLAAQGDYGEIFRTLFRKSLETIQSKSPSGSDTNFVVDAFDVRNKLEYPENVDLYDAVLLTGSGMCLPSGSLNLKPSTNKIQLQRHRPTRISHG